jgi:hypothetical protein
MGLLMVGAASAQYIPYGAYRWTKVTAFDSLEVDTLKWTTASGSIPANFWLPTIKYSDLLLTLSVTHASLSPKYLVYVDYRYIFGPTSADTVTQTYTITPGDDTLRTAITHNLLQYPNTYTFSTTLDSSAFMADSVVTVGDTLIRIVGTNVIGVTGNAFAPPENPMYGCEVRVRVKSFRAGLILNRNVWFRK